MVGLKCSLKYRIKNALRNYQKESENKLINNPKSFWTYINNSKKHNQYPNNFYVQDSICSDTQIIANSFAEYFSSVFSPSDKRVYTRDLFLDAR